MPATLKGNKKNQIEHHAGARPRRAAATAPLCTGADTCKTGPGAGKRSGAKSDPVRKRRNHAWTEEPDNHTTSLLAVCWLRGWVVGVFVCATVAVVLGDACPLSPSPCNTVSFTLTLGFTQRQSITGNTARAVTHGVLQLGCGRDVLQHMSSILIFN